MIILVLINAVRIRYMSFSSFFMLMNTAVLDEVSGVFTITTIF